MYKDEEQLTLPKLVRITAEEHELLRRERNRLRVEGRQISMAKLLCNLIRQAYGTRGGDDDNL
jgi:hypothetical protein